jgi:hypothetical protein
LLCHSVNFNEKHLMRNKSTQIKINLFEYLFMVKVIFMIKAIDIN